MIPLSCILLVNLLIAFANCSVGSASIFSYMFASSKCSFPSAIYLSLSSITMPEPLSAFFITMSGSAASSLRALVSALVMFGKKLVGSSSFMSFSILCRYLSTSSEALGGNQVLFCLNGCISFDMLFLK